MSEKKNIFIVGTGTDIGKTYIAGLIVKKFLRSGINTAYFKAAMSGNVRDKNNALIPGDALFVKIGRRNIGRRKDRRRYE